MKLRLPHQFQAALMAAIASVSLSTLSTGTAAHGAATLTDIGTWTGYDEDTATAVVGNTGAAENPIQYGTIYSGSQSWNTSWAHVVTVDAASLLSSDKDLTIYAVNMKDTGGNIGYSEGVKVTGTGNTRTITMTSWSNAAVGSVTKDLTQYGTLTFVMSRDSSNANFVVKVYADGDFTTELMSATQSGQTFTNYNIYSAETGTTGGKNKFNNTGNKVTLTADANVGSYEVLGAGYVNGSTISTQDLQTYYNNITVLQWNGTDNSDWSSTAANWLKWGEGEAMAFTVTGAQALFGKGDGLSKIVNVTGDSAVSVSAVKVVDNYTFNMAGNLNAGKITIAEGASLARTGSGTLTGTLAGAGTYVLKSGESTLGSVTLGSDWTGTVRLVNVDSFGGGDLATFANVTLSTVELNGIKGYTSQWKNGHYDFNIRLTDNGNTAAWNFSDGSSGGTQALTLNGSISGHGTLQKTKDNNQGFVFTGDISEWDGMYKHDNTATSTLTFKGNATVVNATINKANANGTINVNVGDGTNAFSTTFNKAVTATKLAVNNNADATFKGTTNITNGVTLGSGSSLTNTGDMTLDGTIAFGDNPILNNGSGAITLGNSVKFNLNGMTPDANNKYTLFSGTGQSVDLSGYDETYLILQGGTAGKEWHFGNDGTISFSGVSNKVWSGNDFYWNHTSTTAWKDGTPFKDGDSVRFDDLGDMAYVVIDENVQASTIQVGDGATVIMSTSGRGALSASALVIGNAASVATSAIGGLESYTVGAGASWNIDAGVQTLKAGGVNNGTIVVASSGSVTVEGTTTAASMSGFQNNGTLSIALADATDGDNNIVTMASTSPSTGTLEVRSGTIDYRSKLQSQTLRLGNGARLLFGNANDSHEYSGAIEVAGNASVRTHGTSKHAHVTISGAVTGAQGTLTREDDGNQDLNFTGNVNLGSFVNNDQQPNSLTNFQGPTELGLLIAGNKSKTVFSGGATIGSMALKGSAAVEIASATSVTTLLDLSNGQESQQRTTGTLSVKDGGVLTIDADASYWGRSASHLLLEDGGMLNIAGMNIVGTAVPDSSTEISTTSDNAKYGIASTDWTISDAAVTATQGLTIGNKLLNSSIATGSNAVTLNNAANVLTTVTVGVGGALTFSAAAELLSAINNSGTVVFTHDITATGLAVTTSNFNVGLDGKEISTDVTNANYFAGGQKDTITVVNGGTVTPNNHKVVQNDVEYTLGADGKAVHTIQEVSYGTFYQHEKDSELSISTIAQKASLFFNVDVKDAVLNLDQAALVAITAYNAELKIQNPENALAYYIAGGTNEFIVQGTESLDLPSIMFNQSEASKVVNLKHADGSDYTVTDNTNASVRITSLEDDALRNGQVTITAAANAPQSYAVNSGAFDVNATKLEKIADSRVQVSNTLNVKEIHNADKAGDFVLTKGVDAAALDTVIATSGNIEFYEMSSTGAAAQLARLDIAANKSVSFYSSGVNDAKVEASVTVSGTLDAGVGAQLNANLEMVAGSHLSVGEGGLNMGCTVTLNQGMTLESWDPSMGLGDFYVLFTGVDGLDLGSGLVTGEIGESNWIEASQYFTNIENTDEVIYLLYYGGAATPEAAAKSGAVMSLQSNGSNVGMVYIYGMATPEPTTGTLSLLAFCALAARRRRKG